MNGFLVDWALQRRLRRDDIREAGMKRLILNALLVAGIAAACAGAEDVTGMYKTRPGDTLDSIARRFRMKTQDLSALNRSIEFDQLQVGQPIRVRLKNSYAPLLYPTIPPQVVP